MWGLAALEMVALNWLKDFLIAFNSKKCRHMLMDIISKYFQILVTKKVAQLLWVQILTAVVSDQTGHVNYEPKLNWSKYRSQDHALLDVLVRFHAWIKLFTDFPPHFFGLSALQQLVIFGSVCFACNHISYFTFFLPFISFFLFFWGRLCRWQYS